MRKLAWAAFSFAAGICFVHYVLPEQLIGFFVAGLSLLCLCGYVLLRGNMRTRVVLACVFVILGIFRYEVQVSTKLDCCREYVGEVCEISAVVTEYPDVYDSSVRVTVQLLSEEYPQVKAQFYDYNKGAAEFEVGDFITGSVKFNSAELRYGVDSDNYISKGIYLRGYFKDDPICHGKWEHSELLTPIRLAQKIRDTLERYVPEHASAFMKALLTGDKTALYAHPEQYYALTRAGIAHVVAVSGMHVGFLVGLVMILLGNRYGWIFGVSSIIVFAVMTGLSPSVIRAVLMQILFLSAPMLRREPDGLTSIAFALLLILTQNPFSIASVSLQLSFASMMGIVLLTPRILQWFFSRYTMKSPLGQSIYAFVAASLSTSLGATAFTAPLCAVYFGSISILAPLTNLLVLWIVPVCFALGLLICIVAPIWSFGAMALGKALGLAVGFVYQTAELISAVPMATVYLPTALMVAWFLASYLLIMITYLRKGTNLYRPLCPIVACALCLFVFAGIVVFANRQGVMVAAVDVGQGQSVVVIHRDQTIMVDCGGEYDAGDTSAKWLYAHGRYHVDGLFLTHFDEDHVNGVVALMSQIPVSQLIITSDFLSEDQRRGYEEILTYADMYQVNVVDLSSSANFRFDEIAIQAFVSENTGDNEGLAVLFSIGEFDVLVMGDADTGTENDMVFDGVLPDGEILVVGHHGSKYSTGKKLLEAFKPESAIISVGYNSYGHPTQEVLDRLLERNVVVYRTDEQGTIEMKVR